MSSLLRLGEVSQIGHAVLISHFGQYLHENAQEMAKSISNSEVDYLNTQIFIMNVPATEVF